MSSSFLFQLGLDLAHSVFWGRVHFSAPGGFCVAWWRNGRSHDPATRVGSSGQRLARRVVDVGAPQHLRGEIYAWNYIFSVENWFFYIVNLMYQGVMMSLFLHAMRQGGLCFILAKRYPELACPGYVQQNRIKKMQQVCLCSNMICITFLVDSTPSAPFGTWKHHEWSQFARRVCPPCTARWLFGCCMGPS